MKVCNKFGFTLVEILLVVVLLGIISGLGYPLVIHLMDSGFERSAVSVAQSVNAAKQSYKMRHYQANQEYGRQSNETDRYALIKEYMPHGNVGLNDLLPKGYSVELGSSIRDRVGLRGPKGEISY